MILRTVVIGTLLALIALAVFLLCLLNAKTLSLLVDRIYRRHIAVVPVPEVHFEGFNLEFAGARFDTFTPDTLPSGLTASLDAQGRMSFHYGDRSFPCGPGRSLAPPSQIPNLVCIPYPGDQVNFVQEQSTFDWPTPFETNLMTGYVARWRRNQYRTLAWTKANGAHMRIYWRFEQGFYRADGWRPENFNGGTSGLVDIQIGP